MSAAVTAPASATDPLAKSLAALSLNATNAPKKDGAAAATATVNKADEAEFAVGLKTIKEEDKEDDEYVEAVGDEINLDTTLPATNKEAKGNKKTEFEKAELNAKREHLTIRDFEVVSELGAGNYGKVLLVRRKDSGAVYAMKVLQKQRVIEKRQVAHTMTERNVLAIVSKKNPHPFLVHLHYAFQSQKRLYFIMDFLPGGELFFHLDKLDKFNEQMARFYCAEVALALGHLHSLGVIYRDLKPENVLLDADGNCRLADFGLSKISLGGEGASTLCGTAEYLAPETLMGQRYGQSVDWWALGVLVYELTTGLPPFRDPQRNCKNIYEKILRVEFELPEYLSKDCKSIIGSLLVPDPKNRLGSVGDIEEIKAHPFFKGIDWEKLLKRELTPPYKPVVNSLDDTSNFNSYPSAGFLVSSTVLANRASAQAQALLVPQPSHQRRHTKAEEFHNFSFSEFDGRPESGSISGFSANTAAAHAAVAAVTGVPHPAAAAAAAANSHGHAPTPAAPAANAHAHAPHGAPAHGHAHGTAGNSHGHANNTANSHGHGHGAPNAHPAPAPAPGKK